MCEFELGKKALENLIIWAREHHVGMTRNEATTRLHLIDRILQDVLRWPIHAITTETFNEGVYSDYELGTPAKMLLVEAKREGKYFDLPAGWKNATASLTTVFEASPAAKDAIKQAMAYCQPRGIPYGAVTNGSQFITFIATRLDGVCSISGRALVFSSLDDMLDRLVEFWNNLSPTGITENRLVTTLNANALRAPPPKLSTLILDYPGYKNRNPVATELQILGELFLEDVIRHHDIEVEFLEQAYCKSGALSQYSIVAKEILAARYSTTFQQETQVTAEPVTSKKGLSPALSQDMFAASVSRRPILLVGDVGAGKSIFIKNLVKVQAREELCRALVLYIDFGSRPALVDDLRPYVRAEIERQLLEDNNVDVRERNFVKGVYHGALQRFSKGIWADIRDRDEEAYRIKEMEHLDSLMADAENHLKSCLQHIVWGQKKQVVLFLDNVDQRPQHFQDEVFMIAQALAEHWPITAFVSLRPDTFKQSRISGSLSAYQPRVFTIDPPRIDQVLSKRLRFAKELLERQGRFPWFPDGFTVRSETLLRYISMLLEAFENQTQIIEFIDNMSGGNVRRALDYVATFIGSAHVDSTKILDIIDNQGSYNLPLHEFMRAVIYGDHMHYDPRDSAVVNIFDIMAHDPREHFLLPALLAYVDRAGQVGGADGYVERAAVFAFAQNHGFHPRQIDAALMRGLGANLIATPAGAHRDAARLRITTVGAYTVRRLSSLFAYLDAMIVDTPVTDTNKRHGISDSASITERLDRAEVFMAYLDDCWKHFDHPPCAEFDWSDVRAKLDIDIARVRGRIGSAQSRGIH